jgi:hypothetical protein
MEEQGTQRNDGVHEGTRGSGVIAPFIHAYPVHWIGVIGYLYALLDVADGKKARSAYLIGSRIVWTLWRGKNHFFFSAVIEP